MANTETSYPRGSERAHLVELVKERRKRQEAEARYRAAEAEVQRLTQLLGKQNGWAKRLPSNTRSAKRRP